MWLASSSDVFGKGLIIHLKQRWSMESPTGLLFH
jgi:hypothetical protein